MKVRLLWLIAAAFLSGCAHNVPTWSKANAEARESGMFIPDDNYYHSAQYVQETMESVNTVLRLKQQIGHENARPARERLNASMRSLQQATEADAAKRQHDWETKQFPGSSNIVAKVTTMPNPMDDKGRIIIEQLLSYYDNGKLRYATNRFDLLQSK